MTSRRPEREDGGFSPVRRLFGLLLLPPAYFLGRLVADFPEHPGLALQVRENMSLSGVAHPVTAVLLNFRGYDTLLEVGVLLLALLGGMSLQNAPSPALPPAATDPVLSALTRFVAPLGVLFSAYLLLTGMGAPGGAFQAGALAGGMGILVFLGGHPLPPWYREGFRRLLLSAGFIVFLSVASGVMAAGKHFLEYPRAGGGFLIFIVEVFLALSIACILFDFFAGHRESPPPPSGPDSLKRGEP